jgi:hypothetical protein
MTLWPDIVVTRPDSPEILLVVEVKGTADKKRSEGALKSYMVHVSCPVGMLVTPEQVRFYRNRYTDYGPQAVELIAECPTSELLGTVPQKALAESELELERSVEERLERLQAGSDQSWPSAVREAIESSVLPAVSGGIVRAGGPRWRRAG